MCGNLTIQKKKLFKLAVFKMIEEIRVPMVSMTTSSNSDNHVKNNTLTLNSDC